MSTRNPALRMMSASTDLEEMLDVAGDRFAVLDVTHLVEPGTAKVLAEQQVLELALGALVDLQPVGVEEADVGAALVEW